MKKVSIITISYNNCQELEKTINSVISQQNSDYEFIVIDGGSQDGSVNILNKYNSNIDYWVSEPDSGIYNAMNKGIEQASGEWIFFLNSGDIFASDDVLKSVDFDVNDEKIGAIYGKYKYYTRYNELQTNHVLHPFFSSDKKYRNMGFSHQSVFVRTVLAKRFHFDETYKLCADYDMMMRIYKAGYLFKRDETIIAICDGRGGASFKNRNLQEKEMARVCGCNNDIDIKLKLFLRRVERPIYRKYMNWRKRENNRSYFFFI